MESRYGESPMVWSELERLVEDAESDEAVRRALRHCRSRSELVLAARQLGYRITRVDLRQAWTLHLQECGSAEAEPDPIRRVR